MNKLFFGLIPLTALAAISLGIVSVTFDPFTATGTVKLLFFASLSAFLWGCGAIVFFILNLFSHDRTSDALRRGFFVALLALIIVFFKKYGILHWYTGFAAIILTMLAEFWIYMYSKISVDSERDM